MNDAYKTIESRSEGLYKEKGSKFIALAFPVSSVEDVKQIQTELRKEFYDARHHCYAYCIGKNGEEYRANDDGEPNHSAGDPILGQIRSKELTNTLVVVVRYFGGTKLGVGGLISAYKIATKEALENSKILAKYWKVTITIKRNYEDYSTIMSLIKEFNANIVNQEYSGNDVELTISINESQKNDFLEKTKITPI